MSATPPSTDSGDAAEATSLARKLVRIAVPVALTQLGIMGFNFVDTIMLGRVGVFALDASALGTLWFLGTTMFGIGVIMGLDPILTQAHGRGDAKRLGQGLHWGLITATWLSLPLIALGWLTEEALVALGQDAELAAAAETYVRVQVWSIPPLLWFFTMRQYLQAREIVAPALWVTLIANVFNVGANEALIFGHFADLGLPALGLRGAGVATGLTRSFICVALAAWILRRRLYAGAWHPWSRESFDAEGLLKVLRFGAPVGLQYTVEVWAFQATTLLAGTLGREALAAHTIVLNLTSVTFMVPLGISFGASTVVGNLIGSGRLRDAQRSAWIGVLMGAGVMSLSAIMMVSCRELLPLAYTREAEIVALAATLLPITACFQIFDGIQVVGSGVLRGMGDTVPAAGFNLFAYFGLALPLAGYLVLRRGYGLPALWVAMALGLAVVAVAMVAWIYWRGPARRPGLASKAE